jgi:PilZ domain-containing protein
MSRFIYQRRDERLKSELVIRMAQGEGTVRDLSASGIYFITDMRLKAGDTLKFSLEFQDSPTGPLSVNCTAHVVRSEKHAGRNGVAASITGMEFVRIPKAAND